MNTEQSRLHQLLLNHTAGEPTSEIFALLSAGIDVTFTDRLGRTLLHLHGVLSDPDICKRLIEMGADLHAAGNDGLTPLHLVAIRNLPRSDAVCAVLTDSGADPNAEAPKTGRRALHFAATSKTIGAVRALISAGADLESRDKMSMTPLMTAIRSDSPEICAALVGAGANTHGIVDYCAAQDKTAALSTIKAAINAREMALRIAATVTSAAPAHQSHRRPASI